VAGRATYSEADKAKVYVVLQANDGNVKRTARETGVPENTVRRWRNQFQEDGPPDTELVEQEATDFIEDADRVRHKALRLIEEKVDQKDAKLNELNNTVGILTDKIDRVRLPNKQVDHVHHLPPADEIRQVMAAFAQQQLEMAQRREEEIVDAEFGEIKALPTGT
jgi:transposase-like protein